MGPNNAGHHVHAKWCIPAHVLLDPGDVAGVCLKGDNVTSASDQTCRDHAENSEVRTNIVEHRARLEVPCESVLDFLFVASVQVMHFIARINSEPEAFPQTCLDPDRNLGTSTNRLVKYPASAVLRAVSARPLRAP